MKSIEFLNHKLKNKNFPKDYHS